MNFKAACFCLIGILTLSSISVAQFDYDFFWSDRNLNEGAVNGELFVELNVGDTAELYLYCTTNGPADANVGPGSSVDVSTSASGIIQFESAESFDFEIVVVSAPDIAIGSRWLNPDGTGGFAGPANDVTPDFVDEIFAFTVSNQGIQESNNGSGAFVDLGYDAAADAFLFGKVTLTALAEGELQAVTVTGETGCVDGGQTIEPVIGLLSIIVGDAQPICAIGDLNGDGVIDLLDVQPFVEALLSMEYVFLADINEDGFLDLLDVQPFIDLLTN